VYFHRRCLEVVLKSFAAEAGLCANADVELSLVEGALIVRPIAPQLVTLDELLRDIT